MEDPGKGPRRGRRRLADLFEASDPEPPPAKEGEPLDPEIVAGLTASGALAPSRVAIKDPAEAKGKNGSDRIASELSMEAPDR